MDETLLLRGTQKLVERAQNNISRYEDSILDTSESKIVLGNTALTLLEIVWVHGEKLMAEDRITLIRVIQGLDGLFINTFAHMHYVSFLQLHKPRDESQIQVALNDALGDVIGTRVLFSILPTRTSFVNSFMARAPWVIDRCRTEITNRSVNRISAVYLICNLTDALKCADPEVHKTARTLLSDCLSVVKLVNPTVEETPKLATFVARTLLRYGVETVESSKVIESVGTTNPYSYSNDERAWLAISLYEAKSPRFNIFADGLDIHDIFPNRTLPAYVRAGHYLMAHRRTELVVLNLPPRTGVVNVQETLGRLFPRLGEATQVSVTSDEISGLLEWDDSKIRKTLAEIINENPTLTDETKRVALAESIKPHQGHEFSDMDVPLTQGGVPITACFVIKSGVEIPEKSVPEKWWYQITKPFDKLSYVCSIFISPKPCSEPLKNHFKVARDHKYQIAALDGEMLARVLKAHGKL